MKNLQRPNGPITRLNSPLTLTEVIQILEDEIWVHEVAYRETDPSSVKREIIRAAAAKKAAVRIIKQHITKH